MLANKFKRWEPGEDARLRILAEIGFSHKELEIVFGRPAHSIRMRMAQIGCRPRADAAAEAVGKARVIVPLDDLTHRHIVETAAGQQITPAALLERLFLESWKEAAEV